MRFVRTRRKTQSPRRNGYQRVNGLQKHFSFESKGSLFPRYRSKKKEKRQSVFPILWKRRVNHLRERWDEEEREREIKKTSANSNIEGTRSREGIERRAIFLNRACSRRKLPGGSVLESRSGQIRVNISPVSRARRSSKVFQHPRRALRIDGTRLLHVDRLITNRSKTKSSLPRQGEAMISRLSFVDRHC